MICKECKFNNNGWCYKYKKQKPLAIKDCSKVNGYNKGDILLVKNSMRYIDVVSVLNVFYSDINDENILFVSSLIFKEKSYINKDEILGIIDLVEGVEFYEDFRKMVQSK